MIGLYCVCTLPAVNIDRTIRTAAVPLYIYIGFPREIIDLYCSAQTSVRTSRYILIRRINGNEII